MIIIKQFLHVKHIKPSHVFTIIFGLMLISGLTAVPPIVDASVLPQYDDLNDYLIQTSPVIFSANSEITLSNLPRVGDVVNATFTVTSFSDSVFDRPIFYIHDGMEFVDIPDGYELTYKEPQTSWGEFFPGKYILTGPVTFFESNETKSFTVQIKSVSEGENRVVAYVQDEQTGIAFVIGSTETLLTQDYYAKYHDEIPEEIDVVLPQTYEEQKEFEENHGMSFGVTTIQEDVSESYYSSWLSTHGYPNSYIETTVDRVFSTNSSTTLASTLDVFGTLTMDNTPRSPDASSTIGIHGAKVCLREFDNILGVWNEKSCTFTGVTGGFIFQSVSSIPTSSDGSLDLGIQFRSDSTSSIVQDMNDNFYQVFSATANNVVSPTLDLSFHIPADLTFNLSHLEHFG